MSNSYYNFSNWRHYNKNYQYGQYFTIGKINSINSFPDRLEEKRVINLGGKTSWI